MDRIKAPVAAVLPFGTAFHNTVEGYLRAPDRGRSESTTVLFGKAWANQIEKEQDIDWGDASPESLAELGTRNDRGAGRDWRWARVESR